MKVKCGKETIEVSVEDLDLTVKELKEQLKEITNYTDIKLIHAGKVLKDDTATIASIPGGLSAKLTMMGSTATALESLKDTQSIAHTKRVIDDLSSDTPLQRGADTKARAAPRQHNPYKFQSIQTLPGLPDEAKARQILETLANDEGVLVVMAKHKWSVGALCELYPEGYVGVSDVCVMGLNENHGQRILLRLRTDDMKGFRKILSIRKVLCHELAHNVHSEHDSNFYVLMRQVEREIVELDWKNSKGKSLSGHAPNETYNSTHTSDHAHQAGPAVHILGGSTDPLVQQLVPARYLAGTAAILRLTAEEKEVEDNCGSVSTAVPVVKPEDSIRVDSVQQPETEDVEMKVSGDSVATEDPLEKETSGVQEDENKLMLISDRKDSAEVAPIALPEHSDETDSQEPSLRATSPPIASPVELITLSTLQENILSHIDESVAFALETESSGAPVEKLLALRDSFSLILKHIGETHVDNNARVTELTRCLQVLLKIVSNAKDNTDVKYRTVKKTGVVFQRDVASVPGATDVLVSAGFSHVSAEQLVLTRQDPGLLYVVASVLQTALQLAT
eukprot:gene10722-12508_t